MAIVKEMQDALNKYGDAFNEAWAEFNKANEAHKQQRMTGRVLDEKRKERNAKLLELSRTANDAVTAALNKYVDALPGRYAKDPEKLDANALAMLTGAANGIIELTANDVESLFARFDGNLTMQGAISDFASKHDTGARITFYSEAVREADAMSYAAGCRGAISHDVENPNLPITFAYYCESNRAVPPSLQGE